MDLAQGDGLGHAVGVARLAADIDEDAAHGGSLALIWVWPEYFRNATDWQ
jgi:hypothetical protein